MANLTRRQWPLGWTPSQDKLNGNREGLLRMDNLYLDEEGVISIVRGTRKLHPEQFPAAIHTCYSKYIGVDKYRFVGLKNGEVRAGTETTGFNQQILSEGSTEVAAFGSAFGEVIICSGASKPKKYRGADEFSYDLTPHRAGVPGINIENQDESSVSFPDQNGFFTDWVLLTNNVTNFNHSTDFVQFDTDPALNQGSVWVSPAFGRSINSLVNGDPQNPDDDTFKMNVRIGHTDVLVSIEVIFYLAPPEVTDNPDGTQNRTVVDTENTFKYVWPFSVDSNFVTGINAWNSLSARRGDFVRSGNNPDYGWGAVTGVQVNINTTDEIDNNVVTELRFQGGVKGQLYGTYRYAQVNVNNNGTTFFRSPLGQISTPQFVFNGKVAITPNPPLDDQINEIWIFRRDSGLNIDVVPLGTPRRLDKWYRVLVFKIEDNFSIPQYDTTSDELALEENYWWNEALIGSYDIPDPIVSLQSDVFSRVLYLTTKEIYISDSRDPGLMDSDATLKLSGDPTELNLWIRTQSLGVINVGTTKNIYELSGTFQTQPDGTVDVFNKPLGTSHPPISYQFAFDAGLIFYMASDGIRYVGGSEADVVSRQIDLLFRHTERYGISSVIIDASVVNSYPLCIAKDKLWASMPLSDGNRVLFIYDLKNKYWYLQRTGPLCLYEDEDGELIAGYNTSDAYLRQLDTSDKLDDDTGQRVVYLTVYDDDNLPRNRKDTFTWKGTLDTGNKPVQIDIAKNGLDNWISIGNTAFNGPQEKLITIADTVGLGKSYALRIVGDDLNTFKLYNWTIEYDPRPEQLTYLRIPYTNLGTLSRKRFVNYGFVIDTLGVECEFTPLIDGTIAGSTSLFSHNRKGTHIHYFDSEQVGIDIGGIICGFFEYYGPNLDEITSEKLPTPTTYLVIPQNDFGVPNRKRHSSYKFIINTRGSQVRFTPRLDGVNQTPLDFSTSEKSVVEYFFSADTVAINIGGTLESINNPKKPFEFYGPIVPQQVEVLPPRLKEFRIPESNFGVAAKKRIRTLPMEINTNGHDVNFTPIVDGVSFPVTILNTATRATTFHYFGYDSFGVDYSGDLIGTQPFEFYGFGKPEGVEVLPVAKKFDQIGPIRLDKLGKFQAIRLRIIPTGLVNTIPIKVISETDNTYPFSTGNTGEWSTTLVVVPNKDDVYEIHLPKTVNGTIFRIEIGPTVYPFHRYDLQAKIVQSGMEANPKWLKVQ